MTHQIYVNTASHHTSQLINVPFVCMWLWGVGVGVQRSDDTAMRMAKGGLQGSLPESRISVTVISTDNEYESSLDKVMSWGRTRTNDYLVYDAKMLLQESKRNYIFSKQQSTKSGGLPWEYPYWPKMCSTNIKRESAQYFTVWRDLPKVFGEYFVFRWVSFTVAANVKWPLYWSPQTTPH